MFSRRTQTSRAWVRSAYYRRFGRNFEQPFTCLAGVPKLRELGYAQLIIAVSAGILSNRLSGV